MTLIVCLFIFLGTLSGAASPQPGHGSRVPSMGSDRTDRQAMPRASAGEPSDGSAAPLTASGIGSPAQAWQGGISQAAPSHGRDYLAIRAPRGTLVRICAARCITLRSTDYGPSSRIDPPRIADLALVRWEYVCDLPASRGVCQGTIQTVDDIALPQTDTED